MQIGALISLDQFNAFRHSDGFNHLFGFTSHLAFSQILGINEVQHYSVSASAKIKILCCEILNCNQKNALFNSDDT